MAKSQIENERRPTGERPIEGSAVVNVWYRFPDNGWLAEKIAPIPPESRLVVGGREVTHIVLRRPFGSSKKMVNAVGQETADKILTTRA